MTTRNSKKVVSQQPSVSNQLYLIKSDSFGCNGCNAVAEPEAEYASADAQRLQDKMEEHLARYHYHQLSLLALANNETYKNHDDWEYGAYLAGRDLQKQGEALIEALSKV